MRHKINKIVFVSLDWPLKCSYASVLIHSVMSDSAIPWTIARQAPLSMGFPRQEYWSELPFPSLGDLLNSGISCQ